ncbi:MAG: Hpt domain-containing protein [Leptolyngbyaceae cyanobacterium SM1_3_5]|nr:Hpt domain-containing protein [Leptolyngbyaceae cyanobacterium SM1_3_5]
MLPLRKIWQRTKSVSFERVQFLEQAIAQLRSGSLDEAQRQKASQTAHKLAGSLGTFGFEEGSRFAHQLEALLESELQDLTQQWRWADWAEQLVTALSQELSGQRSTPPPEELSIDQPLLLIVDFDFDLAQKLWVTEDGVPGKFVP